MMHAVLVDCFRLNFLYWTCAIGFLQTFAAAQHNKCFKTLIYASIQSYNDIDYLKCENIVSNFVLSRTPYRAYIYEIRNWFLLLLSDISNPRQVACNPKCSQRNQYTCIYKTNMRLTGTALRLYRDRKFEKRRLRITKPLTQSIKGARKSSQWNIEKRARALLSHTSLGSWLHNRRPVNYASAIAAVGV